MAATDFSVHYSSDSANYPDTPVHRLYAFSGLYEAPPARVADISLAQALARMAVVWEGDDADGSHMARIYELAEASPLAVRIMAADCSPD